MLKKLLETEPVVAASIAASFPPPPSSFPFSLLHTATLGTGGWLALQRLLRPSHVTTLLPMDYRVLTDVTSAHSAIGLAMVQGEMSIPMFLASWMRLLRWDM